LDLPDKIFVDPSNAKVRLSEKTAWVGDIIYVRYSKMIEKERALAAQNSAPAVVRLRALRDENIVLQEKVVQLARQLGIEKTNYEGLVGFFNERYPDDIQEYLEPKST